jgi:hypothetical protein
MAKAQREVGEPLPEVRHFAGVELDVGPAEPDSLDVHEQLPRTGLGRGDIPDASAARAFDDECAHYWPACR